MYVRWRLVGAPKRGGQGGTSFSKASWKMRNTRDPKGERQILAAWAMTCSVGKLKYATPQDCQAQSLQACMHASESVKVNKDHEERKGNLLFSSSSDLGSKQQCWLQYLFSNMCCFLSGFLFKKEINWLDSASLWQWGTCKKSRRLLTHLSIMVLKSRMPSISLAANLEKKQMHQVEIQTWSIWGWGLADEEQQSFSLLCRKFSFSAEPLLCPALLSWCSHCGV